MKTAGECNLDQAELAAKELLHAAQQEQVLTSTNPTGGANAWHEATLAGNPSLTSVSCPSISLCIMGAQGGTGSVEGIYSATNPTGGSGAWTGTSLGTSVHALSCPSTSFCVTAAGHQVLTSINPAGGVGAWTATSVDPSGFLTSVSCPSASLCVAGDQSGNILTSTNPTGGVGAWSLVHVDDSVGEDELEEGSESGASNPPLPPSPSTASAAAAPSVAPAKGRKPLKCKKGFKKKTVKGKARCAKVKSKYGKSKSR
jgi:hypothetical protein